MTANQRFDRNNKYAYPLLLDQFLLVFVGSPLGSDVVQEPAAVHQESLASFLLILLNSLAQFLLNL